MHSGHVMPCLRSQMQPDVDIKNKVLDDVQDAKSVKHDDNSRYVA